MVLPEEGGRVGRRPIPCGPLLIEGPFFLPSTAAPLLFPPPISLLMSIKNIIFDFGGVLLDWNPHYIYDTYFGSVEKAEWFLSNVCTYEWNQQHDAGKPISEGVAELVARFPEWKTEIEMYYDQFLVAMGQGQLPGMEDFVRQLQHANYRIFGLTNWSAETFSLVRPIYPVLDLMEDIVVSGEEKIMKPNPEIFRRALSRFGILPEETVFIDDNPRNVDSACSLGICGVLFTGLENLVSKLCALGIAAR